MDCAAAVKQWRNVSILDLAKELCAPFGIEVVLETEPGKPLAVFKTEPGETVFKALERAAKIAGILLVQARGALVLTHAGAQQAATPLVLAATSNPARPITIIRSGFQNTPSPASGRAKTTTTASGGSCALGS
ncbi:hypothetical protein J4530_08810 [Neisseria subflava]|uniref:hypothetical protein n=1 Tax=Neisseria subflava TaxID=28449 RepID=UPI00202A56D0|nr:hypothetical protein [Neisseria subflava]MCL9788253.1 hypothetical protein [Neisseria subflava]